MTKVNKFINKSSNRVVIGSGTRRVEDSATQAIYRIDYKSAVWIVRYITEDTMPAINITANQAITDDLE